MKTNKTAILLGATGLTGGHLLEQLMNDSHYEKVILFSRRATGTTHKKVKEHLIDLFELEKHAALFKADVVFCCIGTTQKKTPDEETYRKIDFGIPVAAVQLAKRNKIPSFLVISSMGATPNSRFFYNKTKGEMEQEVLRQNIPETYIFRPSLIVGNRKEKRRFELLAKKVMQLGNYFLFGPLKKYRSISAESIANAMFYVAKNGYFAKTIESDAIQEIADKTKI